MKKINPIEQGAIVIFISMISAFCAVLVAGVAHLVEYSWLLALYIGVVAGIVALLCLIVGHAIQSKEQQDELPLDDGEH